ncbi:MAG: FeoB-associated Cys-rich membrane protein [Lachnospiraceae bacterium]|nr:FeoB-associated Cys-rich membrane protein [Lachnospiraceae bacterium]
MNGWDVIVAFLVGSALFRAIRVIRRRGGTCGGECGGDCGKCSHKC